MYLRTTKRTNRDGSVVEYYQLAETVYNRVAKRPEARIIHNFGRVDQLDPEELKRLARSILRVCEGVDLDLDVLRSDLDIDLEDLGVVGVFHAAEALWEELGIGEILRARQPRKGSVAFERILLAMVANRLDDQFRLLTGRSQRSFLSFLPSLTPNGKVLP